MSFPHFNFGHHLFQLDLGVGESKHEGSLRAFSQMAKVLRDLGYEPYLFSKLGVLGAPLSHAGPKS